MIVQSKNQFVKNSNYLENNNDNQLDLGSRMRFLSDEPLPWSRKRKGDLMKSLVLASFVATSGFAAEYIAIGIGATIGE